MGYARTHLLVVQHMHGRGVDVNALRSRIGFVFQQFNLFPHLTVLQDCVLAPVRLKRMPQKGCAGDGVGHA
jgi:polar amino acid transport system ATP-binding protein